MQEIEANKKAWGSIAGDHYEHFRKALVGGDVLLNRIIREELGDVRGKSLIHLQCNTGADTISLARLGAKVTGVDLAPENVQLARQLAVECGVPDAEFIEADIMTFETDAKYDVVFTSEGAIGWLPDRAKWARLIRNLLRGDGFLYVFDSHPVFLAFDEEALPKGLLEIKYPYFSQVPDKSDTIGGYASAPKRGDNYFWSYTASELINSLIDAGLSLEFFNEHDVLYCDEGQMQQVERGLFRYPQFAGKLPCSFSLRAKVQS